MAEAEPELGLVRLECGRDREQLAEHLLSCICSEPRTVIGLDFAFSLPRWYLQELGISSAPELWQRVASEGEAWLAACRPPWWGRASKPRPVGQQHFRQTELDLRERGIATPKSVFQIGGAGSVGTGSLRGMPLLHRLHAAGACIWPFDPPGWPVVLEIYPRLLTGAVNKSSAAARAAHLQQHWPELAAWRIPTDDAFDAAVSALVMARNASSFESLPTADPLEGAIWQPSRR